MQFKELLREHNIRYETEGRYSRPGWLQFRCPFCLTGSDPHKLYMGYNIAFGYCNCWRCGNHSVASVLAQIAGITYGEAKRLTDGLEKSRAAVVERPRGKLILPSGVGPLKRLHKDYLRARGFDHKQLIQLWGIQGIGMSMRFYGRLFIPITLNGEVVSWTTRAIDDSPERYISAKLHEESYPHKELLYGEEYCRHAVICHEGPTDVWRTGPGAVATLGVIVGRSQLNRLAKYITRVICFDDEPEAQRRARRLCDLLEPFPGETINVKLDAKDADSASKKELRQLRKFLE